MTDSIQVTVTRLLGELQDGDQAAFDELFPLVYDELRVLAHRQRRRWHDDRDPTLNTTALVHEAYLKLVDGKRARAESQAHFLAVASKAMRHILCNYARDRRTKKRGGDRQPVPLERLPELREGFVLSDEHAGTLTGLDDALRKLGTVDRRQSDIVECRFFGGMSIADTAAALGISPATVKRNWAVARAWLYREMQRERG